MHKNAQKFEWQTWKKISQTTCTLGGSMVRIAYLKDALDLEARPVGGQSL